MFVGVEFSGFMFVGVWVCLCGSRVSVGGSVILVRWFRLAVCVGWLCAVWVVVLAALVVATGGFGWYAGFWGVFGFTGFDFLGCCNIYLWANFWIWGFLVVFLVWVYLGFLGHMPSG